MPNAFEKAAMRGYSNSAKGGVATQRASGAMAKWKKDPRFPKRFTAVDEGGVPCPTLEEIRAGMAAIREANALAMLEKRKPELGDARDD